MFASISKILNPFRTLEKIGEEVYQSAVVAVAEVLARLGIPSTAPSPARSREEFNCLLQNSAVNMRRSVLARNCKDLAKTLGRPVGNCETKIPFEIKMSPSRVCVAKP